MNVIIANILGLIGSIIMVYSGIPKSKKKILTCVTIYLIFFTIQCLLLKAYAAVAIDIFAIIRNFIVLKKPFTKKGKAVFVIIMAIISLSVNNSGLWGILPILATALYTIYIDEKNVLKFKGIAIGTNAMWCIYDFYVRAYSASLFDFLTIISTLIAIIQILKAKKKDIIEVKDKTKETREKQEDEKK